MKPAINKNIPKFYRLKKGKTLFAFGDEMGMVPVLNSTLNKFQTEVIEQCGAQLFDISDTKEINETEYFVFDEDLFFTLKFVSSLIDMALKEGISFRTTLSENTFNERFVLPHTTEKNENLTFNFFYITHKPERIINKTILQTFYPHYIELPDQIVKGGKYHTDQCDTFICRIASPFHLLQLNLAVNFMRLVKVRNRFPQWMVDKYAPNYSRLRNRSLKSLNKFGKHCKIHPRAIIENAILGHNVSVGANAIIRNSFIGDDSHINDNVSIMNSVLGKRNVIANGNHINLCLTYDDVFLIHGPYQFSVFGRSSAVFAVINCDIRLDQKNISIPTDVGILDSLQPLLGIAYGHFSKVGGGNIIAAGRIIPNHKHISPPDTIILNVD